MISRDARAIAQKEAAHVVAHFAERMADDPEFVARKHRVPIEDARQIVEEIKKLAEQHADAAERLAGR